MISYVGLYKRVKVVKNLCITNLFVITIHNPLFFICCTPSSAPRHTVFVSGCLSGWCWLVWCWHSLLCFLLSAIGQRLLKPGGFGLVCWVWCGLAAGGWCGAVGLGCGLRLTKWGVGVYAGSVKGGSDWIGLA